MAENESLDLGSAYSQRWDKPLPPAFARHLISTEILSRDQSQEGVIALLTRYRNEWMAIVWERGRKGHNWATLLGTHEPKLEGVTHAFA